MKTSINLPELDDQNRIMRSFRDAAPAHYIFKIQSFSSLSKNSIDKHESFEFEAGGYQWKLALHPNGNKSREEKDHLSLYLVRAQTSSLPPNWEINVIFRFFLYDQIRDRYLTVQDANGGVRRFHALKTEWGFDQFVPLSIFNDPASGYLVDDTCVFGTEVFVIKSSVKCQCLSMIKNAAARKYTWKIQNFSLMKDEQQLSDMFIAQDYKWNVKLYPKGYSNSEWKGISLSLYLNLVDAKTLSSNQQLYVNYRVRLLDQITAKHVENTAINWFSETNTNWGWHNFLLLKDLNNPENDREKGYYLLTDTCIIEAEVTVMGVANKF